MRKRLHVMNNECYQALRNSCELLRHACILEHSACILEHTACMLEHTACIQQLFGCVFKLGDRQTDRQTDIRTCCAASSQLKIKIIELGKVFKIFRQPPLMSFLRFPKVIQGFTRFPKVTKGIRRFPKVNVQYVKGSLKRLNHQ